MTVTVKNIIPAKFAESSQTTQYTAPSKAVIDSFTVTNTSAAVANISVNIVPPGGTLGDSNLIIDTQSLQPGQALPLYALCGQVMENGSVISTLASAATALTIRASGREIT